VRARQVEGQAIGGAGDILVVHVQLRQTLTDT
jgi:hypothetical protein